MFFFLLDVLCWQAWYLLVWSVQYLGPLLVLIQLIRLIRADADLTLLTYERFGKMPCSLRGQVVWITGASSGIGEHLAYVLTQAGCKLILSARRKQELDRVKQACLGLPWSSDENILVLPFDLLDTERHKELTNTAVKHFGKVDILVNNAGRVHLGLIQDTDLATDRAVLDLLVLAQISLTKTLLPHFKEKRTGHVVVTSSVAGKIAIPNIADYIMAKHALHGFYEALRMEHAGDNIDVTLACPGPVLTNIEENRFNAENEKPLPDKTEQASWIMKLVMSPERCAELMAVAIANKQGEAWIASHPYLVFVYLGVYFPDCFRWLCKFAGQTAELGRQGKLRGKIVSSSIRLVVVLLAVYVVLSVSLYMYANVFVFAMPPNWFI